MMTNTPLLRHLAPAAMLLAIAAGAQAQATGSWLVRAGLTQIKPEVASGSLTPPSFVGTQADVRADTELAGGVTYVLGERLSIDLPVAYGFTHDIVGAGAIAGVGKIGEVKALPITAILQVRFDDADRPLRPYLGAGITYARFYKARATLALTAMTGGNPVQPTTLSVDSTWAPTLQVGATWAFGPRWFADANLTKTLLKTRTTLSTGQTLDIGLDPWSYSIGVGYRF